MNLYELLGVSPSATPRDLKTSYRRLLLDGRLSDEQFAVIEDAYATLSDDQLRQAYDEKLKNVTTPPPGEPPVTKPTPGETPIQETDSLLPSPSSEARGLRTKTNGALTICLCVAAALAAGPLVILIIKFGFDKDPLRLWEQPPRPVVVRYAADLENPRVTSPSTTPKHSNNSNSNQLRADPQSTESEEPTQPRIPRPDTPTTPNSDANIPPPKLDTNPSNTTTSKPTFPNTPPETTGDAVDPKEGLRMLVPTDNELTGTMIRLERIFLGKYDHAKRFEDPETQNEAFSELALDLFETGKKVMTHDSTGTINNAARIERYAFFQVALRISLESGEPDRAEQICKLLSLEYQIDNYKLINEITRARFDNVLSLSQSRVSQFLDVWRILFEQSLNNLRISIDAGNKAEAELQLELIHSILKQLNPSLYVDRAQLNVVYGHLFNACLFNSDQLMDNGDFDLGLAVLKVARSIAVSGGGKTEEADVSKIISRYTRFPKLKKDFEAAKLNYKTSPNDPDTNTALAFYVILVKKDWSNGLFFLALGRDPALAKIAKADNQATAAARERNEPVRFTDEMQLAEQWRKLYKTRDQDDNRKEIVLRRTNFWYEQTFPDLTPLQKLETEKLLNDLNNGLK